MPDDGAPQEPRAQAEPADDTYVIVLLAKGGVRLQPGDGIRINGFTTDAGPATVSLLTRFQEIRLPTRLPPELIFDVRCPGNDLEDAVARGSALATSLAPLISFAVNGFVDVPRTHLEYKRVRGEPAVAPGRKTSSREATPSLPVEG